MIDEHVVTVNGHNFKITWSGIIQLGLISVAMIGIYFTSTGRMDRHDRHLSDLDKRADIADDQRNRMDREGTRRSHEIDATQQQMIDYHTAQLADINRKLGDIMPKVDKIDANVLWLMGRQLEARK